MNHFIGMSALALVLIGFLGEAAVADIPIPGTPIWGCSIKAKLHNDSGAFIIGQVDKYGPAKVNCYSLENLLMGKKFSKDVYMEIIGPALGIDFNFVDEQTVYMATGDIGLRDWRELLGRHSINIAANVNVLVLEAGVSTGVEFGDRLIGLRRSAEISKTKGLGATLSIQAVNIYDSKPAYLKAKAKRVARQQHRMNREH